MEKRRGGINTGFLVLIIVLSAVYLFTMGSGKNAVPYTEMCRLFEQEKVESFIVSDKTVTLYLEDAEEGEYLTSEIYDFDQFYADLGELIDEQRRDGIITSAEYKGVKDHSWIETVVPYAAMIIMFFVFMMVMMGRIGGGGHDKMAKFGTARVRTPDGKSRRVTFRDVAGADEEKEELSEIVGFLRDPAKFNALGARIPKGVLLVGPPGTGKTLLAKAVAGEASAGFLSISGSDFVEMYVGVGASRVRDLFEQAKKISPCIVFIDEIDAVGRQRGTGLGGGHDEREQTLNQLLVEMDGFAANSGVVVLAATNRAAILDPALLRPGRFDRQIYVGLPDIRGREEILGIHAANKPLSEDVDLKVVARGTAGFTGADLENLMNEAALLAAREDRKAICEKDIEEATMKVIAGPEKKSRIVTERDKKITAYHEAGHAVAAYNLPTQDKVHQVTIIQRGMAAGLTVTRPDTNDMHMSRNQMRESIVMLLGGRVAEEIFLDDICTGASNDIERATKTARNMVTRYGFSDKLGTVAYGSDSDEVFLGKDYGHVQNYSQSIAAQIDDEVKEIIEKAYAQCKEILTANANKMHLLADYLLKYEKIDNDKFERLMRGENIEADKAMEKSAPVEAENIETSENTEE